MNKLAMMKALVGFMPACALGVAAQLRITDELAKESLTSQQLAARIGADPDALPRLLRALQGLNVVVKVDGAWTVGPAGHLLQDRPGSLRGLAVTHTREMLHAWADLEQSVITGAPAFNAIFGEPYFSYAAKRPELSAAFDHAMQAIIPYAAVPLLRKDWTSVRTVVDVAGGTGHLLTLLLSEQEHLQGTLFDQDHVVEPAEAVFADARLTDRTTVTSGDMFRSVPHHADVYILSQVLHDWDDEAAVQILSRVKESMHERSQLVVLELVTADDGGDHLSNWLDLHMLTVFGGRERSMTQWNEILAAAGFRVSEVLKGPRSSAITAHQFPSLIEPRPNETPARTCESIASESATSQAHLNTGRN